MYVITPNSPEIVWWEKSLHLVE